MNILIFRIFLVILFHSLLLLLHCARECFLVRTQRKQKLIKIFIVFIGEFLRSEHSLGFKPNVRYEIRKIFIELIRNLLTFQECVVDVIQKRHF